MFVWVGVWVCGVCGVCGACGGVCGGVICMLEV